VPIVVFALGAVFATPLWLIECDEVQDGVEDDATATKDEMCSFYEWWKVRLAALNGTLAARARDTRRTHPDLELAVGLGLCPA